MMNDHLRHPHSRKRHASAIPLSFKLLAMACLLYSGMQGKASAQGVYCHSPLHTEFLRETIVVPSNAKPGQLLGTLTFRRPSERADCYWNGVSRTQLIMSYPFQQYGDSRAGYYVPNTNPGLGFRVRYNGTMLPADAGIMIIQTFTSAGAIPIAQGTTTVDVIKVGTAAPQALNVDVSYPRLRWGNMTGNVYHNIVTVLVAPAPTCRVGTGNISIDLGQVRASTLPSVGSTSPTSTPQNVSVICSGSPSVRMTMSGNAAPGLNDVIALSDMATPAKGVGVQLLYNNAALVLNRIYNLSSAAPSTLNVPIAARYYRIGDISGGTANASAILTFTYN
ncbi:fimbrial protein [Dyella sp.]|uniref:fimbrial protein n=1 Tax=Dyella sp. TaxID=1869338 RepID=UPI002ED64914